MNPSAHPRRIARNAASRLAAACLGFACAIGVGQEPVRWNRLDLEVPYQWYGPATPGTTVVLYYSTDRGRNWANAGSGLPQVRSFRFRAPADGEYWFAIRTYNAAGQAAPAGPLGPEMKVLVDTAGLRIERFQATLAQGALRVALDANAPAGIDPDDVRLYAQAEGRPGWLPVPMQASRPSGDERAVRLEGAWVAPAGAKSVTVRATLADRSGKRVEESTVATLDGPAAAPLLASAPPTAKTSLPATAIDPFAAAERNSPRPTAPAAAAPVPLAAATPPTVASAAPGDSPWPSESPRSQPTVAAPAAWSERSPFRSAGFRAAGADAPAGLDGAPPFEPAPASDAPRRVVNCTDFEFDYELERSGRWGVGKVELWGTDNGGRSWRRFAIDSDRQSPIHVNVPGEGEYGFRLLVESVGGLEAPTPVPGDAPEAIVEVDLRKPTVALRGARQGEGYFADQLVIEWSAEDRRLADRPIDLFYSNRVSGPWVPIATSLPNTGRHAWRLQRHLPSRPFVRLEARDAAGNVSEATTPEPIEIDVPTAAGSLRGVRASG